MTETKTRNKKIKFNATYYTYVVTYTFATGHEYVAQYFRMYLTLPVQEGGLGAEPFDQSTYGIKTRKSLTRLIVEIRKKVNELYSYYGVNNSSHEDEVHILVNPIKVPSASKHISDIYRVQIL